MSYPKVLALLDAQLERLRAAREVLTSGSKASPATSPAVLPEVLEALSSSGLHPASAPSPVSIEPTRIAPKQRREPRTMVRRKKVEEQSALQNAAPQTPVYVPAGKVRSERAEIQGEQSSTNGKVEVLSPELLARRWLQNSAR